MKLYRIKSVHVMDPAFVYYLSRRGMVLTVEDGSLYDKERADVLLTEVKSDQYIDTVEEVT